ncbi:MAG: tRNA (adenosine(37)-N6)-dimethylallyltransferase MiaA [Rickettsiales bacterium]
MTNSISKIPNIKVIVGATASGKSAFALSLAQKIGGVIINADSQQVYSDLRILTARPTPQEETQVPHKLYGTMSANENCSAGVWLRYAKMEIDWARTQNITPIVVGGTGLYIKSLTQGIAEIPDIDASVRAQATSDYEEMGKEAFSERLRAIDPAFFERLKVYDKQRLVRAYEVWLGSGKSLSWWQSREVAPPYPAAEIEITKIELPREEIYRRCNARFEQMIEAGAVDEVSQLMALNLPDNLHNNLPIMKTIGVRELAAYLRGEMNLEQAIELCQTATRQYAKRQMTWFRNQV